jgi:hypothetical protein
VRAIEASEHEPIDVVEDEALGRLALQHIELMTKNENFSVQRSARPEQPSHKAPNQPTDIAHNIEYHPIRRRSSAIWFAVGTGVTAWSANVVPFSICRFALDAPGCLFC